VKSDAFLAGHWKPGTALTDTLSMMHHGSPAMAAIAAALLLGLGAGTSAEAAAFSVNPTQIHLATRSASALLSLRNDSTQALRFELTVSAWSQSASGEMTLEPTKDVVFFPSLLTLKPGEERKVRVGTVVPPGAREKTYRIFIKELPPLEGGTSAGVRVLTTMGIPIFVRPDKELSSAALNDLRHGGGTLQFALSNTGTVHFVPQKIAVTGFADGSPVFEQQVDGWYVLAATRREFSVPLPAGTCARLTSVLIHVEFASGSLEERLQTPGGVCAP
jgi:fimbrial chaperone protein